MKSLKSFFALVGALALSVAANAQTLNVGDPAPPIKVQKWIKGTPVESFEKGKVYVFEFWATWCGPCKEAIPHLTELAKKHAGKVVFTGVSVWEHGDDIPKLVTDFVASKGDVMDYNVALDEAAGTMANTWLLPAGRNGIPATFVINGDGIIAWVGHPMNGLDKTLDAILDGSFDLNKSKAEFQATAEEGRKQAALTAKINKAGDDYASGKKKEAVATLDKIAAKNPRQSWGITVMIVNLMAQDDVKGAELRIKTISKGMKPEDAPRLGSLGAQVATHPKNAANKTARDFGLKVVLQANKLGNGKDVQVLSMLGAVYFDRKDAATAVFYIKEAIRLLPTSEFKDNADAKKYFDDKLKEYEAGVK
jgi:thiol-disulfide isomerase/thioredoxin